ncbi:MAG: type II toxin-antitoxin system VapC family toxin [Pseudomonadota bacterium]
MKLVVDASVAVAWTLPDETSRLADAVLAEIAQGGAMSPVFFKLEFANVLAMAVRRSRIDAGLRDRALEDFSALGFVYDNEGLDAAWTVMPKLAEKHRLSVYDACYLELAKRKSLPLATLDKNLSRAAHEAGVQIFEAVA